MKLSLAKRRMYVRYGAVALISALIGSTLSYIVVATGDSSDVVTQIRRIIEENAPTDSGAIGEYNAQVASGLESAATLLSQAASDVRKSAVVITPPVALSGVVVPTGISFRPPASTSGGQKSATIPQINMNNASVSSVAEISFPETMRAAVVTINGKVFPVGFPSSATAESFISLVGTSGGYATGMTPTAIIDATYQGIAVGRWAIDSTNRDAYMALYCPQTNRTGVSVVSTAISGKQYTNDISIVGCPAVSGSSAIPFEFYKDSLRDGSNTFNISAISDISLLTSTPSLIIVIPNTFDPTDSIRNISFTTDKEYKTYDVKSTGPSTSGPSTTFGTILITSPSTKSDIEFAPFVVNNDVAYSIANKSPYPARMIEFSIPTYVPGSLSAAIISERNQILKTIWCGQIGKTIPVTVNMTSGKQGTVNIKVTGSCSATVTPPVVPPPVNTSLDRGEPVTINGRKILPGLGVWGEAFAEPVIVSKSANSIKFSTFGPQQEVALCKSTEGLSKDCDDNIGNMCFYHSTPRYYTQYNYATKQNETIMNDEKVLSCNEFPVMIGKLIQPETNGDVGDPYAPYTYKPVIGAQISAQVKDILGAYCKKDNFTKSSEYGYFGVTFYERTTQGKLPGGVLGNLVVSPCGPITTPTTVQWYNITASYNGENLTLAYAREANGSQLKGTYYEKTYLFKTKITDTSKVLSTGFYCDTAKNQVWDKITMRDGSLKYKYTGYKCEEAFYN